MKWLLRSFVAFLASASTVGAVFAQTWTEVTPAGPPAPSARTLASAVYDPVAHAMVVFGGEDAGARRNDIWALDLANHTWTELTPGGGSMPAGRITPASVYDVDHHQMLMFSGRGAGGTFLNDTWAFDLNANTWSQFTPAGAVPAIRYGVATCYDVVGQTQVTFAGFTFQGRFDDTWRFDPAVGEWSDVSPVSSPLERCLHGACYDAINRRMIMYGGQNGGALGDIWSFDLATETWTELTPLTGPDPRWFSTFEYDRLNHRVTMFSGNRNVAGLANDVWVFDLSLDEWIELFPGGTPPSAREGAVAVYVQSEDRIVVFGGEDAGGLRNDVWSLDDLTDTPTGVAKQDVPDAGVVLRQNHPNPFNASTVIRYELSSAQEAVIIVYDVKGRKVRELYRGHRPGGVHAEVWDGRDDAGRVVGSGVYLYRLQTGDVTRHRKMILLK